MGLGVFCVATMLPIAFLLRRKAPPVHGTQSTANGAHATIMTMPAPPKVLQSLLMLAGVACCVAMSMPQVHMIAYCGDLGYGPARGAERWRIAAVASARSRVAAAVRRRRLHLPREEALPLQPVERGVERPARHAASRALLGPRARPALRPR